MEIGGRGDRSDHRQVDGGIGLLPELVKGSLLAFV